MSIKSAFLAVAFALSAAPAHAQDSPLPAMVEASPVPAEQPDTRWQAWRTAAMVAHAADFATTGICLRRGTCHEVNPLIGRYPSTLKLAAFKSAMAAVNYALITRIARDDPGAARVAGMVSVGVIGGVAAANLRFVF